MAKSQPKNEATDVAKKQATEETSPAKTKKTKKQRKGILRILFTPFVALGRYFKGAWQELRQVRWPTRRATWALTLAVILFTVFFVIIIVALDSAFQELFKRILL